MKKILLVDDDLDFRAAIKQALTEYGHTVVEAENGKAACDALMSTDVDLIVSDFQMPHMDGIELLKWVKNNKPVPFILITAFSHILETQEAFKLGCDDFLAKPFGYKDILDAIAKLQTPKVTAADNDMGYCRIPLDDFISNQRVKIGVYIRLASDKYVRVAHQGDRLPADRIENYKRKGITYLFANKTDFAQLVNFNISLSRKLSLSKQISPEKKLNFLRYSLETALEHCVVRGFDKESFTQAKDCMESCLSVLCESNRVFSMLETLNQHANWLYAHCIGTSIYSVSIGKKLGWNWPATLFKLSSAGLFHDIGQKELDVEILEKSRPLLTLEERSQFETHPTRSREILVELSELPSDIVQIAYEHQEDCLGTGYPRRINKQKIHPLAKVISVADRFCYYAIKNPQSQGCNAREALQQLEHTDVTQLDKEAMSALKSLCLAH